jgi:hypothetical protein
VGLGHRELLFPRKGSGVHETGGTSEPKTISVPAPLDRYPDAPQLSASDSNSKRYRAFPRRAACGFSGPFPPSFSRAFPPRGARRDGLVLGRRRDKSRKLTERPNIRRGPDAFPSFPGLRGAYNARSVPVQPDVGPPASRRDQTGAATRLPPTGGSGGDRSRRAEVQPVT